MTLQMALGCLGFSNLASNFITDQQGLDSLEEFRPLTDEEVKSLDKVTRHPGVTIPDAVAGPQLPLTLTLVIPVSLQVENNLKLMCYLLQHIEHTSCTTTAAGITIAIILTLHG